LPGGQNLNLKAKQITRVNQSVKAKDFKRRERRKELKSATCVRHTYVSVRSRS